MTQKISHGFRFHLEAWHWGSLSADDLMDQARIPLSLANTHQLRSQQSLSCKTMASGAVDPKQLASMVGISVEFKRGLDIGILLSAVNDPKQQHSTGESRQNNKRSNQAAAAVALFCCS